MLIRHGMRAACFRRRSVRAHLFARMYERMRVLDKTARFCDQAFFVKSRFGKVLFFVQVLFALLLFLNFWSLFWGLMYGEVVMSLILRLGKLT